MGSMLPYIAAPWILWDIICIKKHQFTHVKTFPQLPPFKDPNQLSATVAWLPRWLGRWDIC